MAKFYIVARKDEDYSLITVEDGNHLEDIDILTSKFADKSEFIKYLNEQGYSFTDDIDLYIVNKGKKDIYHRELIFGNKDLKILADTSKSGSIDVTFNMNMLLQRAQASRSLRELIGKKYFTLYGDLDEMILNSKSSWLNISTKKNWMRNNYFIGRDSLATISIFDQIKNKIVNENCTEVLKRRRQLTEERRKLDHFLDKKINHSNEQIALIGEPKDYINLTYINKEVLGNSDSKKIKRVKKSGLINDKLIDKLTIPFEVITDEIDYRFVNNIAEAILSMPFHKVPWGKKERYEIDFKKWTRLTGIECNDHDARFLNSLLETSLRQNAYWRNFYNNKEHSTPAVLSEKRRYQRSVYNTLINAAKNKNDTYKKAYNFYLIQQAMINNLNKKDDRGPYGK